MRKDIKLDKKKAKLINGFAGKHAGDNANLGDLIIQVRNGNITQLTQELIDRWKQWQSNEYYVTVPTGGEKMVTTLFLRQMEKEEMEKKLNETERQISEIAGVLQDIITGGVTSRIVVAWRTKELIPEQAKMCVRPQDKMIAFWRHYERGEESLYYGVVEIKGFLDEHISKEYARTKEFRPSYIEDISKYGDLTSYIKENPVT